MQPLLHELVQAAPGTFGGEAGELGKPETLRSHRALGIPWKYKPTKETKTTRQQRQGKYIHGVITADKQLSAEMQRYRDSCYP
jgi:hypothetical protein